MVPIPHLTISWSTAAPTNALRVLPGVFPAVGGLVVGHEYFAPVPQAFHFGQTTVVVIGSPVWGETIALQAVAEAVAGASVADLDAVLRRVNGHFLLLIADHFAGSLTIANDRFSSIPLYYRNDASEFSASFLYADLLKRRGGQLQPEALFEFIWLQRLLMDKTYDGKSRFLMPASVLRVRSEGHEHHRYWRPDFRKHQRTAAAAGEELAELLKASVRRLTSDSRRHGIFLSGGHDSRTVLAASDRPLECFTVGFTDNYEVRCARELAAIAGSPHHFLTLPSDYFTRYADEASWLSGGMYALDHALFLGFREDVQAHSDVVLHGHGIDYMYQGMYLPAHYVHLLGRPTFWRRLEPVDGDVVQRFLSTISYRLKYVDLLSLIRPEWRSRLTESLSASAAAVLKDGEDVCANNADRWEYYMTHALGRHFSHPNVTSKMSCAEARTPAFDIDLFAFYQSLAPELRVTAGALRRALRQMNARLGRVPTGNWGMSAMASPTTKTAYLIGRKLLRHVTGIQSLRAPGAADRTWPDRDTYLHATLDQQALARAALADPALRDALPFFDWGKLQSQVDAWFAARTGGGPLLMTLVTLHRFIRQIG